MMHRRDFLKGAALGALAVPASAHAAQFVIPTEHRLAPSPDRLRLGPPGFSTADASYTVMPDWNGKQVEVQPGAGFRADITFPSVADLSGPFSFYFRNAGSGQGVVAVHLAASVDPAVPFPTDVVVGNHTVFHLGTDENLLFNADFVSAPSPHNWDILGGRPHWGRQVTPPKLITPDSGNPPAPVPPGNGPIGGLWHAPAGWSHGFLQPLQTLSSRWRVEFNFSVQSTVANDRIFFNIQDPLGPVVPLPANPLYTPSYGIGGLAIESMPFSSGPQKVTLMWELPPHIGDLLAAGYTLDPPPSFQLLLHSQLGHVTLAPGDSTGIISLDEWAVT